MFNDNSIESYRLSSDISPVLDIRTELNGITFRLNIKRYHINARGELIAYVELPTFAALGDTQ